MISISDTPSVAILLSTYSDEQAYRLGEALQSILIQTLSARTIVLVVDGPIDQHQEKIITTYSSLFSPSVFRVVRLTHRRGLAGALNVGLAVCSEEFIARMDSDDIAVPSRLEEQCAYLQSHPEIDVIAGWQAEFEDDASDVITSVKESPAIHEEIVRQLKWRNVISHPTIVVRRSLLNAVGGYDETVGLLEDYDLHMRLIHAGARYAVLQKPMVLVRITRNQRSRRGGWRYVGFEWAFRHRSYRRGDLTLLDFVFTSMVKSCFLLLPPFIKAALYRFVRRSTP